MEFNEKVRYNIINDLLIRHNILYKSEEYNI